MNILNAMLKKPFLLDGAMGSQLIDLGMKPDEIPEIWNIKKPEIIQNIHKRYIEAGADAILTNTFGGSSIKLKSKNLEQRVDELNGAAVKLAKMLVPPGKFLIGDIGPSGEFFPPVGNINEKILFTSFKQQANALIREGVDFILIETMYDIREINQAVKSVRSIDKKIPIFVTMTFEKRKKGFFTIMGDDPLQSIETLEKLDINMVGANCSLDSGNMVELASIITENASLPLLFQPNAGQPNIEGNKVTYPQTPKEFAMDLIKILDLGIHAVGGCCGTTPKFIQETRNLMEENF